MGTFKIKEKTAAMLLLLLLATTSVFAGAPNWTWIKSTTNTTTIAGQVVSND